jgi:tetratricopeptide (TPR) repeat protein
LVVAAACGLLLLAVIAVFGQTVGHDFVNFDDEDYVGDNSQVTGGLTVHGIAWAFRQFHSNNWHPLTWLSHMLDCQLYGLAWPGGHHLTNVVLHAASAILLLLVLRQMSGAVWPGALAAGLFAIHPLHVESVAWVAERKDVLSGLFFMLTLAAYTGYARRPFSLLRYLLVTALFALGLMAKPMLVTLPLVLLLLDYWPLGRAGSREWGARGQESLPVPAEICDLKSEICNPRRSTRRPPRTSWAWLIVEKLPWLALAAVSCGVTYWAQGTAVTPIQHLPLPSRMANALVSYITYLGQFTCPAGLAVLYPFPHNALPAWKIVGCGLLLMGISLAALAYRRKCPYLLVGWLWYLGMLVPVIGLVQVGGQSIADRYTYLTHIGLSIALAWGAERVARRWPDRRWLFAVVSALVVAGLTACAWQQASYWQNSETLWTHTLACTSHNPIAHNNLGSALAGRGQVDEAIAHYRKALEIKPDYAMAHIGLGSTLAGRGQLDEAMAHYWKALAIEPDNPEAHNNLGNAMVGRGQVDEAIAHYRKALEIKPDYAEAHVNLGAQLVGRGRVDEAIAHYRKALEIKPDFAEAHNNLAAELAGRGQVDEAIAHYRKALELKADYAEAHNNLAVALAGRGQADEAIAHYRRAVEIKPDNYEAHNNLAVVLARRGQADEAIAHYRKALELKPDHAEAQCNLGNALAGRGQVDEAIAHYRKALEIVPDYVDAHCNLALALAGRGSRNEALSHYQTALGLASARNDSTLADVIRGRIRSLQAVAPRGNAP